MDLCDLNPVTSRHPADPLWAWTTCLARSVDAPRFVRQGGLTRAASFLSRLFALLLLPRAGAGSVGKRRVSAGKAAAECWCREALGVLLPVSSAFATQNSRLTSWAFQFHGKQSRFTFWSQRKRKKVWTCGGGKLLDEKNNYGLKFHVLFQGKEISYLR